MNEKRLFQDGWKFSKQQIGMSESKMLSGDADWQQVDIPHDWLIYQTNDLYETSEGWYQKLFEVTREELEKCVYLQFEGVYMDSTVFVNGQKVGDWKYGYSSFEFFITPYLVAGLNQIMVRVVHQSPNSRWYSGAGIYRNVWLFVYEKEHIKTNGIYIAARKEDSSYKVKTDIELTGLTNGTYLIVYRIFSPDQIVVRELKVEHYVKNDELECVIKQEFFITDPVVWDIDTPNLYTLEVEFIKKDEKETILQRENCKFGLREVTLDTEKGFFLNGKHRKLNGVCQHHDLGCLGAAVNKTAIKRQIKLLIKMGVNAIRTSHNMPAVELMDLADEMGMLIVSEAFDMWERPKTEYDYARFFPEWAEKDVSSWI